MRGPISQRDRGWNRDPAFEMPSVLSVISGATNTDWASRLLGDLSPGEDIKDFKPPADPVMDVDNGKGWCGRELRADFAFKFELEAALVVNERWTSHAVRISDSSRLQILLNKQPRVSIQNSEKKKKKKKNTNLLPF